MAPGVSVDAALNSVILGHTTEADQVIIDGESLSLDSLLASWMGTLENIFPSDAPEKEISREIPLFTQRNGKAPAIKSAKPRVFIPVFPGTNCEVDTARAFEKAGAQPEILVVKNLCAADIEETIERMVKENEQA